MPYHIKTPSVLNPAIGNVIIKRMILGLKPMQIGKFMKMNLMPMLAKIRLSPELWVTRL